MAEAAVTTINGMEEVEKSPTPGSEVTNGASKKRSSSDVSNDDKAPKATKKTKATNKKAANKPAIVKTEEADEDAASTGESMTPGTNQFTPINAPKKADSDVSDPATPPPKKGTKAAKTPTSDRKRAAPKDGIAAPKGIPKSWEEAGPADRMLYKMKEEGKDWASIRKVWKDMTGQDTASRYICNKIQSFSWLNYPFSSLPGRYNRIKCNMMRLKPGHVSVLFYLPNAT